MSTAKQDKVSPLPLAETEQKTHQIFIRDLLIDMLIGVYEHEQTQTQPVRLNIDMTVTDHLGPLNDDYHHVVCYETIANEIKTYALSQHINLVETVAEDVAQICLNHPRVIATTVKVEKLSAVADTTSVGIEIHRTKH